VRGAWRRVLPFFVGSLVCVVAGGLLAAATAYATTQKTAWATAYLVLVGGVAQAGLGVGLARLARPGAGAVWTAFALFTLGNAGVLAGQLAGVIAATLAGAAMLVAALVAIVVLTRRGPAAHPAVVWGFRALVILLAASIPTGLVIAVLTR
jgi:hypothetical protein